MIDSADYVGRQVTDNWWLSKDGDAQARALFDRHYSRTRYQDGRQPKLFVGPGFKRVLVRPAFPWGGIGSEYDALFVWRDFHSADGQQGVCCSIFRNESDVRSSRLILEAEEFIQMSELMSPRFYTYVNAACVRSSNPGFCFIRAGWRRCGATAGGLIILEKHNCL